MKINHKTKRPAPAVRPSDIGALRVREFVEAFIVDNVDNPQLTPALRKFVERHAPDFKGKK